MVDVGDRLGCYCGWSWEENKKFEMGLALIDEDNPDRWTEIAAMIGGKRSLEEVRRHYEALLEDLDVIESGRLDQELDEGDWTADDQRILAELSIKDNCQQQHYSDVKIRCSSSL